jgi:hypothetical protein
VSVGAAASGLCPTLSVEGCGHTWVAGPEARGTFSAASAQCRLFAQSGDRGYFAYGSRAYVATVAGLNTLDNLVRQQENYDNCMLASGWEIADRQAAPAAVDSPVALTPSMIDSPVMADYRACYPVDPTMGSVYKACLDRRSPPAPITIPATTVPASPASPPPAPTAVSTAADTEAVYPPSPVPTASPSPATAGQTVSFPVTINSPYHPSWTIGGHQ